MGPDNLGLCDLGHRGVSGLVGGNVIREQLSPSVVRVVRHIALRARGNAVSAYGSDVVALAKVIPGQDLDKVRVDLKGLFPAVVPQSVAIPQPVLGPLRKVGVEPGRDGHHVGLGAERRLPALVFVSSHLVGSNGPSIPVESTIDVANLRLEALRTETRPVRHEEAIGRALDSRPIAGVVSSLKGGH